MVVLGVSIDTDDAAYHKFLKDYRINMITVRDGEQKSSSLYGTFGMAGNLHHRSQRHHSP